MERHTRAMKPLRDNTFQIRADYSITLLVALENRRGCKSAVGSNPTLSANIVSAQPLGTKALRGLAGTPNWGLLTKSSSTGGISAITLGNHSGKYAWSEDVFRRFGAPVFAARGLQLRAYQFGNG